MPRMKAGVRIDGLPAIKVRIYLCSRDVRMTEHFLNGANVGTVSKQMAREAVPEHMRREFGRDAGRLRALDQHGENALARKGFAQTRQKQARLIRTPFRKGERDSDT